MSKDEILAACNYFENDKNSKKNKTIDVEKKVSKAGQLLMKNVEKVSSILSHTQAHCNKNRQKYYAMTYDFGKPSFWFSFNLMVHNNSIVVYLATGEQFDFVPTNKFR